MGVVVVVGGGGGKGGKMAARAYILLYTHCITCELGPRGGGGGEGRGLKWPP